MTTQNEQAATFLEAIATTNERMIGLARILRSGSEVVKVTQTIDCRRYLWGLESEVRYTLEFNVEATLKNGTAVDWLIEFYYRETEWVVEARASITHDQGQDTLVEFPEHKSDTLDGFLRGLENTVAAVIIHALSYDDIGSLSGQIV
jgi:hypothetical protein